MKLDKRPLLRIAAMPTAQGLGYAMGFDEPAPEDAVQVVEGLTVLVAAGSQPWLAGTVLDYVRLDSGEHDFIFVRPQAAGCSPRGCGGGACGSCG